MPPTLTRGGLAVPGQIGLLLDLQQLDSELDRLRHEVRALQGRVGETAELAQARAAQAQAAAELHQAELALRDKELELGSLRAALAADEKKLYDGSIRQSKELQDQNLKVESEKRRLRQLEDQQLEAMAAVEQAQTNAQSAHETMTAIDRAWQLEQARLTRQIDAERAAGRQARRQRDELVARIPPELLDHYQRLMVEKRGRAVTSVEQSLCLACRINVPQPVINRARLGAAPVQCPSCGRILVVR